MQPERMSMASLSAGPVLHHRSADRKRDARTRHSRMRRKRERERKREERGGERDAFAAFLDSIERRTCSALTGRGAHILISTRSPSYYWLKINRPLRG